MVIAFLEPYAVEETVAELADVLVDCVDGGASVGFLAPLSRDEAEQWWRSTLASTTVRTWVAYDDVGVAIGCVLLALESRPNGRHRAEVRKLLVHRRSRGRGVGAALMQHLERDAVAQGRTLLLLDTETGSAAETLYLRSGWRAFGTVVDHARRPDGALADTTFLVKYLDPVPRRDHAQMRPPGG